LQRRRQKTRERERERERKREICGAKGEEKPKRPS